MAFSGEAQNCKLYVSKNKTKLPEIIFNRASLYEREQKEWRERERERAGELLG